MVIRPTTDPGFLPRTQLSLASRHGAAKISSLINEIDSRRTDDARHCHPDFATELASRTSVIRVRTLPLVPPRGLIEGRSMPEIHVRQHDRVIGVCSW
jgi:hypothetical protein